MWFKKKVVEPESVLEDIEVTVHFALKGMKPLRILAGQQYTSKEKNLFYLENVEGRTVFTCPLSSIAYVVSTDCLVEEVEMD